MAKSMMGPYKMQRAHTPGHEKEPAAPHDKKLPIFHSHSAHPKTHHHGKHQSHGKRFRKRA